MPIIKNIVTKNMPTSQLELKKNLGMKVASLADLVKTQIRELIITGEFKPGQQLKEDELCKLFAISRPPIREAFKTLEASGLVIRKPRKGVFVAEFTAKDVEEVYTIVAMLYSKATEMAMVKITDKELDLLAAKVDTMEQLAKSNPVHLIDYQTAHREFHDIIMTLAGNERMRSWERQLRYQISIISYKSFQERDHLLTSLDFHRRIQKSMSDGDTEKAMLLMEEHVMGALKFFIKKMGE